MKSGRRVAGGIRAKRLKGPVGMGQLWNWFNIFKNFAVSSVCTMQKNIVNIFGKYPRSCPTWRNISNDFLTISFLFGNPDPLVNFLQSLRRSHINKYWNCFSQNVLFLRSFMYMENNIGPSTASWGIPYKIWLFLVISDKCLYLVGSIL